MPCEYQEMKLYYYYIYYHANYSVSSLSHNLRGEVDTSKKDKSITRSIRKNDIYIYTFLLVVLTIVYIPSHLSSVLSFHSLTVLSDMAVLKAHAISVVRNSGYCCHHYLGDPL
jgi:hypothetical protein